MTPLSARKVKRVTADIEAEGLDEPDLRAGRRKGLCCTTAAPVSKVCCPSTRAAAKGLLALTRVKGASLQHCYAATTIECHDLIPRWKP